ncbi:UDP-glucuronosyl and UDP-glucosyl transferase [Handroanthus impetiginosus]|uniref:UDP-glucuronosyl and UDP-glucosyl transferase n=1 Tax=Handroanthus impetiginosus TaxID=429701 RepID=A0A2G9HJH4_9LAMI|nr:UDP-glucuronosyl and UDP-glucosyl transferase [Handroanthus impetiginosus]
MRAEKYHIMMFPWLAFGHMIPFLELSKQLAAKGILISYVSTPKNLQRLPQIPSNLEAEMKFLEIPMPQVEGLPEGCEATIDLQQDQIQFLKKAYDMLAEPFECLLKKVWPDLILIDFAPYWIPEIAAKFGVLTAFFSVYTAATLAYLGPPDELKSGKRRPNAVDYTRPPDWIPFPSLVAHRLDYAPRTMHNVHSPDSSGVSGGQRAAKILEECSFVVVRSCEGFEGEYICLVEELYKRPVLPVGVLPPVPEENKNNTAINSSWINTFKWLDRQKPKSAVFVGFGSEYKMPVEQIHELAFSLELSRLPFVWILRKPHDVDSSDLLPPGFRNRTLSQGIIFVGWAPQLEILAHPAIGGCLFHSGWGTIIESLGFGHPLILLPMVVDQGLNAKLLVEKKVGYEVPRNEDGSFSRETVAESIRRVLAAPEGEQLRLNAAHMRSVFNNQKRQDYYINKFIEHLKKYNELNSKK